MTLFIRANKTANNLCRVQVCGPKISRNTCNRILNVHSHLSRDLKYSHFDYVRQHLSNFMYDQCTMRERKLSSVHQC